MRSNKLHFSAEVKGVPARLIQFVWAPCGDEKHQS